MMVARTFFGLSEGGFVAIIVASLPVLFGVLIEFVRRDNARTRRENHEQHAAGRATLDAVVGKLDVVHGDVVAVREDVAEIREKTAVHEHRLNHLDGGR